MWVRCYIGINNKILSLSIINKDYFEALNVSGHGFSKIIDNHKYIYEMFILDNLLILTEAAYYVGNDNIYAYDWEGNLLWNISEVVGKKDICYDGCVLTSKDYINGYDCTKEMFENTNFIIGCISNGIKYQINPYTREVLKVINNIK